MTGDGLICGAECHYGGLSAARKYSSSDLGWMWHCNRRVRAAGDRCYQHPAKAAGDTQETAIDESKETA
jgi:hypothetical protein